MKIIKSAPALFVFLLACHHGPSAFDRFVDDYIKANTITLSMAFGTFPELLQYDRLFTAPAHAAATGVPVTTTGTNNTFQAGAAKKSLSSAAYLDTLVGDIPLAGSNRKAIIATNVLDEKARPGMSPHHHLFKKTDGILDDIDARAVVISCSGTKAAFVVLDTVAATQDLYDEVFARISVAGIGITNRNQLYISATHTHSGPGAFATRPMWKIASGDIFVPQVLDKIATGIVDAIVAANGSLANAKIGVAKVTGPDIIKNRRSPYYPTGAAPLDHELTVMQLRKTADNSVIATIFNFPIHGTTIEPSNTLLSGDNLGQTMRNVESGTSNAPALFINSAEGDVSPRSVYPDMLNALLDIGTQISASVLTAVGGMTFQTNLKMNLSQLHATLPTPQVNYSPFTDDYLLLHLDLNTSVEPTGYFGQVYLEINGTQGVSMSMIPGEAITDLGTTLKANAAARLTAHGITAGNQFTMIGGLTDGHMGYFTTPAQYDLGGYEAAGTLYGRNTSDFVTTQVGLVQNAAIQ